SDTGTPRCGSRFSNGIEVTWARCTSSMPGRPSRPMRSIYRSRSNTKPEAIARGRSGDLHRVPDHRPEEVAVFVEGHGFRLPLAGLVGGAGAELVGTGAGRGPVEAPAHPGLGDVG